MACDVVVKFLRALQPEQRRAVLGVCLTYPHTDAFFARTDADPKMVRTSYTCEGEVCDFRLAKQVVSESVVLREWRLTEWILYMIDDVGRNPDEYLAYKFDGMTFGRVGDPLFYMQRIGDTKSGRIITIDYHPILLRATREAAFTAGLDSSNACATQ